MEPQGVHRSTWPASGGPRETERSMLVRGKRGPNPSHVGCCFSNNVFGCRYIGFWGHVNVGWI